MCKQITRFLRARRRTPSRPSFRRPCAFRLFPHSGRAYTLRVQELGGKALVFTKDAEQEMIGAYMAMAELVGFLGGVSEYALGTVREGQVDRGAAEQTMWTPPFQLAPELCDRKWLIALKGPEKQPVLAHDTRSRYSGST